MSHLPVEPEAELPDEVFIALLNDATVPRERQGKERIEWYLRWQEARAAERRAHADELIHAISHSPIVK